MARRFRTVPAASTGKESFRLCAWKTRELGAVGWLRPVQGLPREKVLQCSCAFLLPGLASGPKRGDGRGARFLPDLLRAITSEEPSGRSLLPGAAFWRSR